MTSAYQTTCSSKAGFSRLVDAEGTLEDEKSFRIPQSISRIGWFDTPKVLSAAMYDYLHQHRNALRAAPPVLAGSLWLVMMGYFFVYYTTVLNKVNGHIPRIGPGYSTWPYISCVGAIRLSYFRGFACAVAVLVIISFSLDFWLGRYIRPGFWFRVAKLVLGVVSSAFLVLLSFESVNSSNHLHLIFTSIQIWCMGAAKAMDDVLGQRMRRHDRNNKHLLVTKRWKRSIGLIAAATGVVTVIGIYSCRMAVGYLPDTARCWKLVAWSAPLEWVLSLCWVSYLYAIGYDLYHAEDVREAIIANSSKSVNSNDRDEDTVLLTSLRPASQLSQTDLCGRTEYVPEWRHTVDEEGGLVPVHEAKSLYLASGEAP